MSLDLPEIPKPELPAIGILSNIGDEDRQRLGGLGQFLRIKRGGLLIQEGVDQNRLYVVVKGSFKIVRAKTDSVIAILESGESIGEVNIFDPDVASASVLAAEDSEVWGIDREGLETYLSEAGPGAVLLLIGLIHRVSHRVRATNMNLEDVQVKPPPPPVIENWID